jgi:hypothetical protein
MSKTKIELDYPYNTAWNHGYLLTNREGRQILVLFNDKNIRTTTQYARYLLGVKLGRFLTKNETVDHIDNDKTNNSIDNLQILTISENIRKSNKLSNVTLVCPICKTTFIRTHSQLRGRRNRANNNLICCSRSCGGKWSHILK